MIYVISIPLAANFKYLNTWYEVSFGGVNRLYNICGNVTPIEEIIIFYVHEIIIIYIRYSSSFIRYEDQQLQFDLLEVDYLNI